MEAILSNPVAIIALGICVVLLIILIIKGFKIAFKGLFGFIFWILFIAAIVFLAIKIFKG